MPRAKRTQATREGGATVLRPVSPKLIEAAALMQETAMQNGIAIANINFNRETMYGMFASVLDEEFVGEASTEELNALADLYFNQVEQSFVNTLHQRRHAFINDKGH